MKLHDYPRICEIVKAIPVTHRERPYDCEMAWLSHYLENQLTDGGEVVIPTRWQHFTHWNIPGTVFC
jgi:hypothetical protein